MPSPKPLTPRRLMHLLSVLSLLAGVVIATWIFIATSHADAASDAASLQARSMQFDQNRREMAEVERLGGKVSVMTVQFHQWFLSLWTGRKLAYTVLALALLIAWGCRHAAELVDEEYDS